MRRTDRLPTSSWRWMTLRITSTRDDLSRRADRLAVSVAVLMAVQAALGLLFRNQYRDVEWIAATWVGNDLVTLVVAVPLLIAGMSASAGGSERGRLVMLGVLAYGLYNYAYYLFGAALNVFFPVYLLTFVCSGWALVVSIAAVGVSKVRGADLPLRLIGGYFGVVGIGLVVAWVGVWAAHVFFGRATPIEPEVFKLVAALDLSLMAPLLILSGVQLWRRRLGGYLTGAVAGIQASLYLTVLAVNSTLAVRDGRVEAPGELPVWGILTATTVAATLLLMHGMREPIARRRAA
jgi:hypothetical protein